MSRIIEYKWKFQFACQFVFQSFSLMMNLFVYIISLISLVVLIVIAVIAVYQQVEHHYLTLARS